MAADNINIFISYGRADSRELAIRLRDDLLAILLKYGINFANSSSFALGIFPGHRFM